MSTTVPAANTIFDSAAPLLYNVDPWNKLGFGVPNFGRQIATLSFPIWRLANDIASNQLAVMTGVDARRADYPSTNTVQAIAKLVNRVQTALAGRQKQPNDQRVSPLHANPDPQVWLIHPVPYFTGPMVRNAWLREFNSLTMIALTNIYRHGDNDLALTITSDFASQIWVYFREIKFLICTELLGMSPVDASDDTKPMPTGPYNGPGVLVGATPVGTPSGPGAPATGAPTYNPPATIVNTQRLQTPGVLTSLPGSYDYLPFATGIAANLILPNLAQYPVGPIPGEDALSGELTPSWAALQGVTATSGPGGAMGSPGGVTPAAQAVMDAINAAISGKAGAAAPAQASASASGVATPIAQPSA